MIKKNISEHYSWRAAIEVILASLAMIVAAPLFVLATVSSSTGGDTQDSSSILGNSTSQSDFLELRQRVDALAADVKKQNDVLNGFSLKISDANVTAPGMADCLSTCRTKGIKCFKQAASSTQSVAVTIVTATSTYFGTQAETACRKEVDTCILACKPKPSPSPVACESRCAISFGSCIRGVENDEIAAVKCRLANRLCIADYCLSPSVGSLLGRAARVPARICGEQCIREYQICSEAAKYDETAKTECDKVNKICNDVICKGTSVDKPIGDDITFICESGCTADFNKCRKNASASSSKTCDAKYGTCRDNCRKNLGGDAGFGTTKPSKPKIGSTTSTTTD